MLAFGTKYQRCAYDKRQRRKILADQKMMDRLDSGRTMLPFELGLIEISRYLFREKQQLKHFVSFFKEESTVRRQYLPEESDTVHLRVDQSKSKVPKTNQKLAPVLETAAENNGD